MCEMVEYRIYCSNNTDVITNNVSGSENSTITAQLPDTTISNLTIGINPPTIEGRQQVF